MRARSYVLGLAVLGTVVLLASHSLGQQLAKRLILKDGSYQLATKYEVKGERVRYLSAERGEWEELPKALVDWDATDKYEKQRALGAPPPEAVELDRQLEAERKADEARMPLVAPGLHLPDAGGVVMLDTFQGQPQLVELDQSGGDINRNLKGNILKGAINPIATARQTVELAGLHAKAQAHASLPAVYVNLRPDDTNTNKPQPAAPELPWDRFKIVKAPAKQGKRVVGTLKVAVYGKVSQEQSLVETSAEKLTGEWVKITPKEPLAAGEYAVVEMLGKEGMNLNVWDFGVNPSAPANMVVTKPDASAAPPAAEKPVELKKRSQ